MTNVRSMLFAAAGAAAILISGTARAQTPSVPSYGGSGSGGPGTLGSEVPTDSRTAAAYYHSQRRVSGDSDRRIQENLHKLLSENRAALDAATRAMQSSDPNVRSFAQEFADQRRTDENTLIRVAQDSGFDIPGSSAFSMASGPGSGGPSDKGTNSPGSFPSGPSSDAQAAASSSSTGSADATGASSTSEPSTDVSDALSTMQSSAQSASQTTANLLSDAKDENRHTLASALEQTKKALDRDVKRSESMAGSASSSSGEGTATP